MVHIGLSFNLPFLSCIMTGVVPFSTPQTFSRMVDLPALALPITRMRKWGHLYWFLSFATSIAARDSQVHFLVREESGCWPTRCSCTNLCHHQCFQVRKDVYTLCPDKSLEDRGWRVQGQEMMPSARSKLKVQGEAIVCIKPQASWRHKRKSSVSGHVTNCITPGIYLLSHPFVFGSVGYDSNHDILNGHA